MIKNFIIKMNKIFKIDTNKFVKSKKNIPNSYLFDINSKKIKKGIEKEFEKDNFDIYEYFLKNRNDRNNYMN